MSIADLQVLAGSLSALIFAAATCNMLLKAWRTKDVASYSLAHVVLNNVGNLFYGIYVVSLPFGPVHLMHGFYSLAALLMLVWCLMYRAAPRQTQATLKRLSQTMEGIGTGLARQTLEIPVRQKK